MNRILILVFFFALLVGCGDYENESQKGNKYEVLIKRSCGFNKDIVNKKVYAFGSDIAADNAMERIMKHTGLPPNFIIKSANVDNACAVVECDDNGGCKRFIYYNQEFIEKMNNVTNTDFTELAILAHEIGHHLSGHTISAENNRHEKELEADKFAGFILHQLGASIEITKKVFSNSPNYETETHPAKSARIAAISSGWYDSKRKGKSADIWTIIPDVNFEKYLIKEGYDNRIDGQVLTANISNVFSLQMENQNISDLTGLEDFTALTSLYCIGNQLTSLDVSQNTALTFLNCSHNELTSLDVSQNTALEWLLCGNNQLTSLDVSNNTALETLNCGNNQLTSLDVNQNTALNYLYCCCNQLTSLDVSQNTALNSLSCGNNQLTSLDVSQNTVLTNLDVGGNTTLKVERYYPGLDGNDPYDGLFD